MLIFSLGERFRSRIAPLTNWKPLIKVTGSPACTRDALCVAFYALLVVFALFPRLEVSQARMLSTDFAMGSRLKCQHAYTESSTLLRGNFKGSNNASSNYVMQVSNFHSLLLRVIFNNVL